MRIEARNAHGYFRDGMIISDPVVDVVLLQDGKPDGKYTMPFRDFMRDMGAQVDSMVVK